MEGSNSWGLLCKRHSINQSTKGIDLMNNKENQGMKVIITAGGTTEKIDDVRSITNLSTGRLGNAIARSVLRNFGEKLEKLYYIHGTRAMPPSGAKVVSISIGGVSDLENVLKKILEKEKIDAVIHSMAVSDYTVKELTTLEDLKEGKTSIFTIFPGLKVPSGYPFTIPFRTAYPIYPSAHPYPDISGKPLFIV